MFNIRNKFLNPNGSPGKEAHETEVTQPSFMESTKTMLTFSMMIVVEIMTEAAEALKRNVSHG